jgi:glucan biosynthesis protein
MAGWCWVVRLHSQLVIHHDMAKLEIFVVILGETPASSKMFAVTAKPSDTVNNWREEVHKKSGLSGVVARDLVLWKACPLCSLHRPMY